MKKLPSSTIRRLRTDTVVVDVHSAVKELIENALDAGTAAPTRLWWACLHCVPQSKNVLGCRSHTNRRSTGRWRAQICRSARIRNGGGGGKRFVLNGRGEAGAGQWGRDTAGGGRACSSALLHFKAPGFCCAGDPPVLWLQVRTVRWRAATAPVREAKWLKVRVGHWGQRGGAALDLQQLR
jgi:hypothetical protein